MNPHSGEMLNAPDVAELVVGLFFTNLRRQIVRSPNLREFGMESWESKVNNALFLWGSVALGEGALRFQ